MVVETNTKILLTEERQVKVLKAENRPQAPKYLFGRYKLGKHPGKGVPDHWYQGGLGAPALGLGILGLTFWRPC